MEATGINPGEFRDGQRKQWDVAAGGWEKWSELIDEATSAVSERLVDLAGIESGSRVIDVAAGYGEPSLSAARRASEGKVVATDISAEMLAFGRKRAAAVGIENIEFVETDAASLDFPPNSFDAALSRFGIIFDPDGEGAAAKVRGCLEPGAKMAIASWGTPERAPFLALPMRVTMQRLQIPPPPPGTPGPLSRPTPEALGGLLEGGGFSGVAVEDTEVSIEWDSAETFTTFIKETVPPITAMLAPHPPEVQEETWAAITEAASELSAGDGTLAMSSQVLMASGSA